MPLLYRQADSTVRKTQSRDIRHPPVLVLSRGQISSINLLTWKMDVPSGNGSHAAAMETDAVDGDARSSAQILSGYSQTLGQIKSLLSQLTEIKRAPSASLEEKKVETVKLNALKLVHIYFCRINVLRCYRK